MLCRRRLRVDGALHHSTDKGDCTGGRIRFHAHVIAPMREAFKNSFFSLDVPPGGDDCMRDLTTFERSRGLPRDIGRKISAIDAMKHVPPCEIPQKMPEAC